MSPAAEGSDETFGFSLTGNGNATDVHSSYSSCRLLLACGRAVLKLCFETKPKARRVREGVLCANESLKIGGGWEQSKLRRNLILCIQKS